MKFKNIVTLEWFCEVKSKSLCYVRMYISQVQNMANKLKFSMQTHLTHINIIFEYCHASMSLDNVNVLYLEECMQAGSETIP